MKGGREGGFKATSHEIGVLHVVTWIQIILDEQTKIQKHGNLPFPWKLEC